MVSRGARVSKARERRAELALSCVYLVYSLKKTNPIPNISFFFFFFFFSFFVSKDYHFVVSSCHYFAFVLRFFFSLLFSSYSFSYYPMLHLRRPLLSIATAWFNIANN
ncbi:hypothetical protein F4810DRAFT_250090 [Camillea tinctor]|nr:hypothetical protein F4810DRAFT_250090 [Camillea tinctor]